MKIVHTKQNGFSIIELLIAMVLGLVILGAVVQVFANNKHMYIVQEANARLQENSRYSLHAITDKIRKSGFVGCATRSKGENINNVIAGGIGSYLYDFVNPIQGSEATSSSWTPALHSSIDDVVTGTDVLTIKYSDVTYEILGHTTAASDVTIPSDNNLSKGDILIASNCKFATVFQVTSATATGVLKHKTSGDTPANNSTNLVRPYGNGEVSRVRTVSYYISDEGDDDAIPSLYKVEFGGTPERIVAGVTDLQVEYGVDTSSLDGAADSYVTADAVSDWADVVSVRVSLSLRSDEDNLAVDESAGNGYFESQVSRTISLRNKVP